MSQLELAKRSGVRNWNISRAEVGRWNLTEDEQYWIRVALNWPPSVDSALELIEKATFGPEAK